MAEVGLPSWDEWGTTTGRFPAERPLLLCTEIERLAKSVWVCKLFHRHGTARGRVFQRVTVNGNRTEAQRVMEAMYELQKIKEAG